MGYISTVYEWEWERAESEFKQAIKFNPNYATAHFWYACFLWGVGRFDDSISQIKQAQELDPRSIVINTNVGWPYYFSRRYDDAIKAFRNALLMDEGFWWAHRGLGLAYFQKGMYPEALTEQLQAKKLYKDWQPLLESFIGCTYARMGLREEAEQVLNHLLELERSKQEYVSPTVLAYLYLALEENDQVFEQLNRAFEVNDPELTWLKTLPFYDPIRTDPRYIELLRKMDLDD